MLGDLILNHDPEFSFVIDFNRQVEVEDENTAEIWNLWIKGPPDSPYDSKFPVEVKFTAHYHMQIHLSQVPARFSA